MFRNKAPTPSDLLLPFNTFNSVVLNSILDTVYYYLHFILPIVK